MNFFYWMICMMLCGGLLMSCDDGFGNKDNSADGSDTQTRWTISADFEDFEDNTMAVGNDGFSSTTNDIAISYSDAFSGSKVAKLDIAAGSSGFGSWGGMFDFPEDLKKGDEIWYKVAIKFPAGFNYDANPWLKFLRIRTPEGHLDWYMTNEGSSQPYQFIYEGEQKWSHFGTSADVIQFDRWIVYEMYIKLDNVRTSEGGNALVRVWKDGVLMGEFTDRQTLATAETIANYALLFTYWNGENPPAQYLWVDDIVITTETPSHIDADGNPCIGVEPTLP